MPNPSNHVYALKHVYVPVWLSRHFMNPDHALCYKAGVLTPTEGIGDELVQVVHLKGEGEVVTTALNVLLLAVLAQPEWRGFQQCVIADKIVKNAWCGNRGRRV